MFGAKWWEVAGVIVGVAAIIVTIVLFSADRLLDERAAVVPEKINYPIEHESSCTGDWIYSEYISCDDKSKPIYEQVTDADVCGYDEVIGAPDDKNFLSCRHPSHGIELFKSSQEYELWSGWRRGGYSQNAWCNEVRSTAEAEIGESVDWEVIRREERRKEEFFRRFFYQYYCKGIARWNPVYVNAKTEACGVAESSVRVARTCVDPNNIIGYEQMRGPGCEAEEAVMPDAGSIVSKGSKKFAPQERFRIIYDDLLAGKIENIYCGTCDDFIGNETQLAECLISSSYDYMDFNFDSSKLGTLRARLISLRGKTKGRLSKNIETRIDDQIINIGEAIN